MVFLESYHIATSIMAAFSIGGCIHMFKIYRNTDEINKTTPLKIIHMISIALFIQAINFLFWATLAKSDTLCIVVESVQTFTCWLSLFWSLTLPIISFRTVTWMGRFNADTYFYRVRTIILFISLIMALLPAFGIGGVNEVYFSDQKYCGVLLSSNESPAF